MSLTKATYSMIQGSPINLLDYGAVGDGITDNSAAILAAFNAANASGKSLYVPAGIYNIASTVAVPSLQNIVIFGDGKPVNLVGTKASYFRYTGSSGNMFYFDHLAGVEFRDLLFGYNNASYNGDLVRTNNDAGLDATSFTFNRCVFSGDGSAFQATSLLRLEKTIIATISKCTFLKANNGVTLYSYCNVITFKENTFLQNNFRNVYMLSGTNEGLMFYDNTFEPTASGKASGFTCVPGEVIVNLTYIGNWHGDVSADGGFNWLNLGIVRGAVISGNTFGTPGNGVNDYCIAVNNASTGLQVSGNYFVGKSLFFNATTTAVNIFSNVFNAANSIDGLNYISGKSNLYSNFGLNGFPRSKAFADVNQSIPNTTNTAVILGTNIYDQGPLHSTTVNPTRFTVPAGGAGLYTFSAAVTFATGAGSYKVFIRKNGSSVIGQTSGVLSATVNLQPTITANDVAADGDYYELCVYQNTGGALDVIGAAVLAVDTYMSAAKMFSGD